VIKVVILLEELGLPYELQPVAVFSGQQFDAQFLAMNPLGKVPVLVDPSLGRPLYESGAILFYLVERHRQLFPTQPDSRYEVMQWLMVQMANIGPIFGQLNHFRGALPPAAQPYADARFSELARRLYQKPGRSAARARLDRRAGILDRRHRDLSVSLYLERHRFTSADYPALVRWRDLIAARPAVARAHARVADASTAPSVRDRQSATDADLDRFFGRTMAAPPADFSAVRR
jgi:GSH-dependent disulfide-bond oxidoreductase